MNNASFGLTEPRSSITVAKWFQFSICLGGLGLCCFLIGMHIWSVRRKSWSELVLLRNRWRIYLFLTCVFSMLSSILVFLMSAVNWTTSNINSCIVIPNYIAVFFVMMRQCSGLTLWSRALVVHDGLRLESAKLRLYRIALYASLTVGVWIIFGWYVLNYALVHYYAKN